MLLLLLLLPTIKLITGETLELVGDGEVDISFCPISFYGKTYKSFFVQYSNQTADLCFTGYYRPQNRDDCMLLPRPSVPRMVLNTSQDLQDHIAQAYPGNSAALSCGFSIHVTYEGPGTGSFFYYNFGQSSVFYAQCQNVTGSAKVQLLVNGAEVELLNLEYIGPQSVRAVTEMTRCRHRGALYEKNSTRTLPDCTLVTCDQNATLSHAHLCTPPTRCNGYGDCVETQSCSVVGPSVIDVRGLVKSVPDRCVYSLFSDPGLEILAEFMDRRRSDLYFLDSLLLKYYFTTFHLHQGSRVHMNGSLLALNSSLLVFSGAQLSKDRRGVHLRVIRHAANVSVFFDGSTALLTFRGPSGGQGLCTDSTSLLMDYRRTKASISSCGQSYSEDPDNSINCTEATQRCASLLRDPLISNDMDPEPFVKACTNTMCSYPDVDRVFCHFLDVYRHSANSDNDDNDDCAGPSPCVDHYCSSHEFCGLDEDGEARCFCRAVFAAPYHRAKTYGDGTRCGVDSASVALARCLVEEKGFDVRAMHLNDPRCTGHIDDATHTATFSFNHSHSCGAVVQTSGTKIIYRNTITAQDPTLDRITHRSLVYLEFSCEYERPPPSVTAFRIQYSSVTQQFLAGDFNYTVEQKACADRHCTTELTPNSVLVLNQEVWVQLQAPDLVSEEVKLFIDHCWASDQASELEGQRYNLIVDGCSSDDTVQVAVNGNGDLCSFSFRLFQFVGSSGEVFLHCSLALCLDDNCTVECSSSESVLGELSHRRRRSPPPPRTLGFTFMRWTNQAGSAAGERN